MFLFNIDISILNQKQLILVQPFYNPIGEFTWHIKVDLENHTFLYVYQYLHIENFNCYEYYIALKSHDTKYIYINSI